MELGLSTHVVQDRRLLPDDIAVIADAGIHLVEISGAYDHFDLRDRSQVETISEALRKHGVGVFSIHSPHGIVPLYGDLGALAEITRKKGINTVRRSAQACAFLGGEVISIHPGEWFFCWDEKPEHMRAVKQSIAEAVEICDRHGLRMAVETMRPAEPRIGDDYHDLLALVHDFSPDHVGLCLDTNHANLRWDLTQVVRDAGARLMMLHISDNDGREEKHWLPFEGVIDWPAFMTALREVGYNGPLIYEIAGNGKPLAEIIGDVIENYARLTGCRDV